MIPIEQIRKLLERLSIDLENKEMENKSEWEDVYDDIAVWIDGQNDEFTHLMNHIQEQYEKEQYLNAVTTAIELRTLLARKFRHARRSASERADDGGDGIGFAETHGW